MKPRVFLTTIDDGERARALARSWVESQRAACVQVLPGLVSTYRWKGSVHEDAEHLMLIKFACADGEVTGRLAGFAREHPYDVPEFLSVSVDACAEPYAAWLREQSGGDVDAE